MIWAFGQFARNSRADTSLKETGDDLEGLYNIWGIAYLSRRNKLPGMVQLKDRNLKYRIIWKDAWKKMREERFVKPQIGYDDHFFIKTAEDFTRRIKRSDYEFGRKASELLEEILNANSKVLEIGTGPGTLTIPLSGIVKKITGYDFSEINIRNLESN